MGKGSGGGGEAHDYYGTIAGVIGEGLYSDLYSISVDGAEVWPRASAWVVGESVSLSGGYALRFFDGRTWKTTSAHTATTGNAPNGGSSVWTAYSLNRGSDIYTDVSVNKYGTIRIYWGTDSQVVDPLLEAAGNDKGDEHPDYKGICYILLMDFRLGRERATAPNIECIFGKAPNQTTITGDPTTLTDGQANLVTAACELLESQNFAGINPLLIDATSAQEAADYAEDFTAMAAGSPLIDSQTTLHSILADFALVNDVHFWFDPGAGKIKAIRFLHGETPTVYAHLTINDLAERPEIDFGSWGTAKNRAIVQFPDRGRGYKKTSVKEDNLHAREIIGEYRPLTLNRDVITRKSQAMAHASEMLKLSGPQISTTVSVRRERGRGITPGMYVLLDIDTEPGGDQLLQFFRVLQRRIPKFGPIELTLEAEETIPPIAYNPTDSAVIEEDDAVEAITNHRIIDATLPLDESGNSVLVLAQRPDKLVTQAGLWFDTDTGGDFQLIGLVTGFAVKAVLRSDAAAADTTLELTVATQADSERMTDQPGDLAANDDQLIAVLVKIDSGDVDEDDGYQVVEFCSISAQDLDSGNDYDIDVLRGRLGTAARDFDAADTEVWIIPRTYLRAWEHKDMLTLRMNRQRGDTPDTGYFRLTPATIVTERELSDATSIDYLFPAKRNGRPNLTLTAPASDPVAVTDPYPVTELFEGTWSDDDNDLAGWQICLKKDNDPAVIVAERKFSSGSGGDSFSVNVSFDEAAQYIVTMKAWDFLGNAGERTVIVNATGSGAKCAPCEFFSHGFPLPSSGTVYGVVGPIEIRCATVGATIKFRRRWMTVTGGVWSAWYPSGSYRDFAYPRAPGVYPGTPFIMPGPIFNGHWKWQLEAHAELGGFTDGDATTLEFWDYPDDTAEL